MSRKSKKNKNTQPVERKTTQDSFQNPLARTGVFMPNLLEATQYPLTRFSSDWQTINSLYRSHWVVRRIIDVIPEDMTKNGYKITSQIDPYNLKKLETVFRRTSTHKNILKGLKWGRLYGGAGALIMIEGQEDELDQPLDMDRLMPGSYKGLLVLDRWSGITPNDKLIDDPSDPEFGLPESYTLTSDVMEKGIQVHHSRILRFTGRPLPYLEEIAEQYWGASEIEHVIDELKKRDNVSWNIATLTFMASLRVMKMEGMDMVLATGNEKAKQALYNTVQAMNALMNNNSLQILGENDHYETHQYTFGGIAQVYDCFMMDVAGAAETPVTKLFGRSPAGMNATGESDLQNYYDVIEEKQENELRPVYDKLLPIIMMSTFGAVPDDFDYEFNPVRRAPEDEMADLASKNTDSVTKAFQAGLISQKVALKELRQQSELTGMWTNIGDEDIEKADDEVMSPDEGMGDMMSMFVGGKSQENVNENKENNDIQEKGTTDSLPFDLTTDDAEFENKHPRDKDGKFSKGGGNSPSNNDIIEPEFTVPRTLNAMAKRFYVKSDTPLREEGFYIKEGTTVTGVKPIISGRKIRDAQELVDAYILPNGKKTKVDDWHKCRGTANITNGETTYKNCEIHWYFCENIGKVDFKVKVWGEKDED